MTYSDIANMIDGIGIEYAYYQFPDGTEVAPPFICFFFPERDDFFADDRNYSKIQRVSIELYTDNKDFTSEARIEAALEAAGLTYTKEETPIDSEQLYEVIYTCEVIINAE
jgi:hypothetical protein